MTESPTLESASAVLVIVMSAGHTINVIPVAPGVSDQDVGVSQRDFHSVGHGRAAERRIVRDGDLERPSTRGRPGPGCCPR